MDPNDLAPAELTITGRTLNLSAPSVTHLNLHDGNKWYYNYYYTGHYTPEGVRQENKRFSQYQ